MTFAREDGVALLVSLMMLLLLSAVGVALLLTTTSEMQIAANFRSAREAFYAADAGLERTIDDLLGTADWNQFLGGGARSTFTDGPPGGTRTLADGSQLDLGQVLNVANCGKASSCTAAEMDAVTPLRPWGVDNPRWQLYGYGRVSDMLPAPAVESSYYVVVMAGDDPSDVDGDPLRDGGPPRPPFTENPGAGVLALRAEAFGPRGVHRVVEASVARTGPGFAGVPPAIRILSWRDGS